MGPKATRSSPSSAHNFVSLLVSKEGTVCVLTWPPAPRDFTLSRDINRRGEVPRRLGAAFNKN